MAYVKQKRNFPIKLLDVVLMTEGCMPGSGLLTLVLLLQETPKSLSTPEQNLRNSVKLFYSATLMNWSQTGQLNHTDVRCQTALLMRILWSSFFLVLLYIAIVPSQIMSFFIDISLVQHYFTSWCLVSSNPASVYITLILTCQT